LRAAQAAVADYSPSNAFLIAMEVLEQHHDLEQVRALLGPARFDTTQIYTSIRPPQLKRAGHWMLVTRILQRPRRVVAISGKAIERWHRDDPHAWERARAWLTKHDVSIIVD